MALSGQRHIQLARQPHTDRATGLPGTEGGDGGPRICLDFLPAKRAAHSETFDADLVAPEAEDAGDDLLRFRRVLRRRVRHDAATLVHPRNRGLRLEIEMFLPT